MKNRLFSVIIAIVTGCLSVFVASGGSAGAETVRIKLATLAPEGSIWLEEINELNRSLDEQTGNRIRFKVYPGGIMGDDDVVLRKMRVGQLDGALFTTGALAKINPQLHALAFPGLFTSFEEVDRYLETGTPMIRQLLKDEGYEIIGLMGLGFTYMFTRETIEDADDMSRAKAWLWDNDIIMKTMYDHAGITPVSIGISDVMTALQTGLLDTVFNTPTGILSLQWFNRVDRMIDIPLTHAFGSFLLTRRGWSKVPDDLKPMVRKLVEKHAAEITRKTREEDQKARKVLRDRGLQIQSPSGPLIQTFKKIFRQSVESLLKTNIKPGLYRTIRTAIHPSEVPSGS